MTDGECKGLYQHVDLAFDSDYQQGYSFGYTAVVEIAYMQDSEAVERKYINWLKCEGKIQTVLIVEIHEDEWSSIPPFEAKHEDFELARNLNTRTVSEQNPTRPLGPIRIRGRDMTNQVTDAIITLWKKDSGSPDGIHRGGDF